MVSDMIFGIREYTVQLLLDPVELAADDGGAVDQYNDDVHTGDSSLIDQMDQIHKKDVDDSCEEGNSQMLEAPDCNGMVIVFLHNIHLLPSL